MRSVKRLTFWLAVGGVSLISPVIFKIAADKLPASGIKTLHNYVTEKS